MSMLNIIDCKNEISLPLECKKLSALAKSLMIMLASRSVK